VTVRVDMVRGIAPWLLALGLWGSACLVESAARERGSSARLEELLYYPSGFMVKEASLGYETAAADLGWLRAIQYYGEHRLTDQRFDRIDHVMRIIGDLDPSFLPPYDFGAFVLAQEMKQPDRGLRLLRRGLESNPDSWLLLFETGFLYYVCKRDPAAAARYFTLAGRMPDHPDYVERFAAFASQRAGDRDLAILLWKRVLATGNRYMQEVARREIERLERSAS
jgi:tetratricopeptide (TPR) repeat protein